MPVIGGAASWLLYAGLTALLDARIPLMMAGAAELLAYGTAVVAEES